MLVILKIYIIKLIILFYFQHFIDIEKKKKCHAMNTITKLTKLKKKKFFSSCFMGQKIPWAKL